MNDGKWVTLKDGRRVYISTNKYMNDKIKNGYKAKKQNKDDFEEYDEKKKRFEELYDKDMTTARTELYKELGFGDKPKVISEEQFDKIQDKNNPIMQRSTSEHGYDVLVNGEYRTSSPENSMYGTGIYFAYGEEDKEYYARLSNTQKVFEARMDKTAKMIDSKELEQIKTDINSKLGYDRKRIDSIILADYGLLAGILGYDGIYFDNVKYGLVLNRGKLIIKK